MVCATRWSDWAIELLKQRVNVAVPPVVRTLAFVNLQGDADQVISK
jgi:hypothetical protein